MDGWVDNQMVEEVLYIERCVLSPANIHQKATQFSDSQYEVAGHLQEGFVHVQAG